MSATADVMPMKSKAYEYLRNNRPGGEQFSSRRQANREWERESGQSRSSYWDAINCWLFAQEGRSRMVHRSDSVKKKTGEKREWFPPFTGLARGANGDSQRPSEPVYCRTRMLTSHLTCLYLYASDLPIFRPPCLK